MYRLFVSLLFFVTLYSHAQLTRDTILQVDDTSYLEDQFYIGVTYNLLLNRPTDIAQRNLSYGLQVGFIRDIPLNTRRTIAFGVGLGYAINSYYSNLGVNESTNGFEYTMLDSDTNFKRNKLETHVMEMPLEFRWRNSTTNSYKFWRIYTGVRGEYVMGRRSKFVPDDGNKISFNNTDIRRFQYGLTLNFGYNTFNIHTYYSLTGLFNDDVSTVNGEAIEVRPLRIGIIFYIL
ncbi:MAG: porin family protein [Saonia sp.]